MDWQRRTWMLCLLLVTVLGWPCRLTGGGPDGTASGLSAPPEPQRQVVSWIVQAIEDEVAAARNYDEKRIRDARSYESLFFGVQGGQELLVEPFKQPTTVATIRVIYRLPEFGWVIREATVWPDYRLAMFWLGYSVAGPGLNTGFNCTHALSNCKLQDVDFEYIRKAFGSWWLARSRPLGPTTEKLGSELEKAKQRNLLRLQLRLQSQNQR
ncbi:hypothetical protein EG19_04595 [Thermoanaerobaculum aquaticum]|uniref:Uncharacterized protein n=1 Tax=Thermoanaerobaculum aquaticum TaxID=1312852 RepID=A0A062XZE4_9BACT|nr:hypothetical protein [Thermoanaerobaculum aquaticum]KDA53491.1 hypothetical protein EG19_04595 [Thermoanaerobaculum aquaticum]